VLLLLADLLHLPWNGITTWGYVGISGVIALAPLHIRRATNPDKGTSLSLAYAFPWRTLPIGFTDVALVVLFIVALVVRFWTIRDIPTGLFGDSYHHTMIATLLVENAGLFTSWEPYVPLVSFTYHFGFHANAGFFHWITGYDVVQSVLYMGQVINALSVPMAYLLVMTLTGKRQAGLWAALLTGFVATIPAHYVVWGRYTQLTGNTVLVVVVVSWINLIDSRAPLWTASPTPPTPDSTTNNAPTSRPRWSAVLLAALATASMILTHYLVTIFAALFVASYLLVWLIRQRSFHTLRLRFPAIGLALALTLLLTTPWIINLFNGYLVRTATVFVTGAVEQERVAQYAILPTVVPLYARGYVIVAALVGLWLAGWQRQWRVAIAGLWTIILVMCVVPHMLGLPLTGIIDHITALSVWYLTLIPLAAYALALGQATILAGLQRWGVLQDQPGKFSPRRPRDPETVQDGSGKRRSLWSKNALALPNIIVNGGVALLMLAVMGWGATWQQTLIDGSTQLVSQADMQAMDWIRNHTPPEARFLVNSFPAYGGTLVVGSDAGWWIPLLTGRRSTLPPIVYSSEAADPPDYLRQVNRVAERLRGHPLTFLAPVQIDLTTPAALQVLRNEEIDYVYHGAQRSPGPLAADTIAIDPLRQTAGFTLVYEQDGVVIFEVTE
jgi:hypothetical protein